VKDSPRYLGIVIGPRGGLRVVARSDSYEVANVTAAMAWQQAHKRHQARDTGDLPVHEVYVLHRPSVIEQESHKFRNSGATPR